MHALVEDIKVTRDLSKVALNHLILSKIINLCQCHVIKGWISNEEELSGFGI